MFPNLTVTRHPLIRHKVTLLRDKRTATRDFKALVNEIAMLMAYEATKDLPLEPVEVETPLERTDGAQVAGKKLALVPILRAGLGMVDGITQLIPGARVGHIGLYRDHETLQPVSYFVKLPPDIADRQTMILDPMLATGGSTVAAIDTLKGRGCRTINVMAIISAPEGIKKVHAAHPDVDIYTGAVDSHLNEKGYIVPGLGDAGDRLFGTK